MTVQAVLKRTATLLGGAEGNQPRQRLLTALDSALGELARCFPLQARCKITVIDGMAELPSAVLTPRGLLKEGKRVPFQLDGRNLLAEDGSYTLVYYRVPPEASRMEETAELPYPEDLQRALPFYCAALCVLGDDPALYGRLMEQYNTKLAAALGYRPAASVEGGGSL